MAYIVVMSKKARKEVTQYEWLENYLTELIVPPEPEVAKVEEEVKKVQSEQCIKDGCKRIHKSIVDCVLKMCPMCCFEANNDVMSCNIHLNNKKQFILEEKYIEEGLNTKKRKTFLHIEDRFDAPGQTVVLFCLKDFVQRREWSEDIMERFEQLDRVKLREKKMAQIKEGLVVPAAPLPHKNQSNYVDDVVNIGFKIAARSRSKSINKHQTNWAAIQESWKSEYGHDYKFVDKFR